MRHLICLLAVSVWAGAGLAQPVDNPLDTTTTTWSDLRATVVPDDTDPPVDPARLDLIAPLRAADPALVPVHLVQAAGQPTITAASVVVDENPAPVAATFAFGPAMAPLDLELRLRVNAYSNVRAVADLDDGNRLMAGRFVRASGGCAAPAGKSGADQMGQMRFTATPLPDGRSQGKLMIRHPNNSGLQRDQVTLLDIPAHFINQLELRQGDELLWRMEAGISISENPVFVFAYRPNGQPIHVHATDTEGGSWDQTF
ncbi:quinoprotein dehydrogenase-associated SoxYZ-like carrier [Paracoccus sp. p4-l81]|uniref:quinoprotein dehydrogenase-associated SoxYZ-like carrier n=1 Tax=unclassified Paracoccus (in: a-proteobacteria) TaxID=2688777 RepID=UPI0035B98FED